MRLQKRALRCPGVLLAAMAVLFGQQAITFAAAAQRPSVLFVCVDDLKPAIGCYGDSVAVTPNIDELAARGVRFDAAYCNQAVCAPSRNSLMTGLRPQTIGIYDLGTHFRFAVPDAVTVSRYFINQGYSAESLGKIFHTGHGNKDDVESWSTKSWRPKGGHYVHPDSLANIKVDRRGRKMGPATEAAEVPDETYKDGQIASEAIRRLERAAKTPDQPFFLGVGLVKPHLPFVAPQKYWDLYEASALPMPKVDTEPKDAPEFAKTTWGELRSYSDMPAEGDLSEEQTRRLIHGYYAATSYIDAQLGRVLESLDRLNLADNTIVLLWGDHGWHLGDHGMWCKHTNYEQAARIPLIVSAPGGAKGVGSDALIETVDVYPTLAELAGLGAPADLDGQSFADIVREGSGAARPFVTHVYPRGGRLGRAIRDDRYRLVQWKAIGESDAQAELELYDYDADPLETKNMAADHPEIIERMKVMLSQQAPPKPQWKPTN